MDSDERETAVARSLTADLATALSAVPGYRVASQPLGVDFLLEGTVQRERRVLRVNLRFIHATRDSTMWTVVRRGVVDSVLDLQDSVSQAAAAALRSTLIRQ
jgi:TolB-like protein